MSEYKLCSIENLEERMSEGDLVEVRGFFESVPSIYPVSYGSFFFLYKDSELSSPHRVHLTEIPPKLYSLLDEIRENHLKISVFGEYKIRGFYGDHFPRIKFHNFEKIDLQGALSIGEIECGELSLTNEGALTIVEEE